MNLEELAEALEQLKSLAHNNSVAHGFWRERNDNPYEKLVLIHAEVSEVVEDIRKGMEFSKTKYNRNRSLAGLPKPEGIPTEIADILIRCFDFCGRYDIDIGKAVIEKMTYNEKRPYMHGKKA